MLQTFLWKSDCLFELDEDKNINIKNERDKLQNVVHDSLRGNSGWYLVPTYTEYKVKTKWFNYSNVVEFALNRKTNTD